MINVFKKILIGLILAFISFYVLINLLIVFAGTLLTVREYSCKIETDNHFKIIANKNIRINDEMIITSNFKRENYTHYQKEKHLFFKKELEKDFKERINQPYEYVDYNNNEVLHPVSCYSLLTSSYIVFENSKKEKLYMASYHFRRLNYTVEK